MGFENQNFEYLARQHMDALYTHAIQLEPDMQRAEELIQATYQKAFELFSAVRRELDFRFWFLSILDDVFFNYKSQLEAA
jgi:DNA-directed RNA polymerase specialized sigma24 family protein